MIRFAVKRKKKQHAGEEGRGEDGTVGSHTCNYIYHLFPSPHTLTGMFNLSKMKNRPMILIGG